MRCFLLVSLALLPGCETRGDPKPTKTETNQKNNSPTVAKANPKSESPRTAAKPSPEPIELPKTYTFEEAWEEAIILGKNLDKEEPELTAKSMTLLTGAEREEAQGAMTFLDSNSPQYLYEYCSSLRRHRLSEWVSSRSRKIAVASQAFRIVAKALWTNQKSASEVVRMMNT
ncbi:MAG TPA: hypothetical protein VG122_23410 [Gemmata sp.]|jgi:hypothetical protein|nr:hypothetical protein [Gemmata sp.]